MTRKFRREGLRLHGVLCRPPEVMNGLKRLIPTSAQSLRSHMMISCPSNAFKMFTRAPELPTAERTTSAMIAKHIVVALREGRDKWACPD